MRNLKYVNIPNNNNNINYINKIINNDNINNFIAQSFCESEPMCKHLDINPYYFSKWSAHIINKNINKNLSFYISDIKNNILSCIISETLNNKDNDNFTFLSAKPIFDLLDFMTSSIPNKIAHSKTLHIFFVSGFVSGQENLCYNLCLHTLEKAKEYGYKYAIARLTSPNTQDFFINKLGFNILREFDYTSYGKEFKTLNGKCILAAIDLELYIT